MTADDREARMRLVKQLTEGRLTLAVYEASGPPGTTRRLWTLARRDEQGRREPIASGSMGELGAALRRELSRVGAERARRHEQARGPGRDHARSGGEPGRAAEQGREFWAVVRPVQTLGNGEAVLVEVVASFPKRGQAWRHQKDQALTAVWHEPFREEPPAMQRLVAAYGENAALDRQIDQSRWRQEVRGTYYTFGRWYDRDSEPAAGRSVIVEGVTDYRDGPPGDHRIRPSEGATPLARRYDRGEAERAPYVVVRLDERIPNRGRIVEVVEDRSAAVARKAALEAREQANRDVLDPRKWQTLTFRQAP